MVIRIRAVQDGRKGGRNFASSSLCDTSVVGRNEHDPVSPNLLYVLFDVARNLLDIVLCGTVMVDVEEVGAAGKIGYCDRVDRVFAARIPSIKGYCQEVQSM